MSNQNFKILIQHNQKRLFFHQNYYYLFFQNYYQIVNKQQMNTDYNQPLISNPDPYANNNSNPYVQNDNPYTQDSSPKPNFAEYHTNKLKHQDSSIHCQALFATILLIGGEVTGLVLYFASNVELSQGGLIGICVGSYVLYLLVGLICNPLGSYLTNINAGQIFESSYDRVRALIGRFTFHAQCYHYQTRHHTRVVRDQKGNTRHEHYTTTQKVTTHVATEYLTPIQTIDESGKVDRIRSNKNIVFIHFLVRYRFVDAISSNNFQMHYESFKRRHCRDVHQSYTMGYAVPGLIERQAFYVGELGCDYGVWMYIFGLAGLLWPYSLWVESKIDRFSVEYMKSLRV